MVKVSVFDTTAREVGTEELDDSIFGIEPNVAVMHQAHVRQQANARLGTHDTKTRAQVRGGGRKPWRQKGTGRARQGSIRAPQWRGGAVIFGPQPRDYSVKLNKKVKRLALYSALSDLRQGDQISVVKDFGITEPRTKAFVELTRKLGIAEARRILVLLSEPNEALLLSARNLPNVLVSRVENVNIFDLLTCDHLVVTADGIKALEELLA